MQSLPGVMRQSCFPSGSSPLHTQHSCPLVQQPRRSQNGLLHAASTRRPVVPSARRREPLLPPFIEIDKIGPDGEPEGLGLMDHLMRNRIIYIGSRITDEVAVRAVASLMALEAINPKEDVRIYINSAGGAPYHVISLLDTIQALRINVSTVTLGISASTATLLLAAGTKGKRYSMPSARIMMHQPIGGCMGSADEVNIQATELNRTMKVIHQFYSQFTGLPLDRVEEETDRENFVSPQTAKELGLIDAII